MRASDCKLLIVKEKLRKRQHESNLLHSTIMERNALLHKQKRKKIQRDFLSFISGMCSKYLI